MQNAGRVQRNKGLPSLAKFTKALQRRCDFCSLISAASKGKKHSGVGDLGKAEGWELGARWEQERWCWEPGKSPAEGGSEEEGDPTCQEDRRCCPRKSNLVTLQPLRVGGREGHWEKDQCEGREFNPQDYVNTNNQATT